MDPTISTAPSDPEQPGSAQTEAKPAVGRHSAPGAKTRIVGAVSALLMPNRFKNTICYVERDMPCTVITMHGVNDVGVTYGVIDNGLCQGLNERLNRFDLIPNDYLLPCPDDKVVSDPDNIYYRYQRQVKSKSVMVSGYWGYRAAKDDIATEQVHGENVDIHGNRLDKDFAKGGGMFANATSNIIDMYSGSFKRGFLGWVLGPFTDAIHQLCDAPERDYMILAAVRLAVLIKQIRLISPNETVTVLAHSQGTLITLLAQAMLAEEGERAADCAILVDSPYSLQESSRERSLLDLGMTQQTSHARLQTLINTVRLITDNPHPTPPLSDLWQSDPTSDTFRGRTGPDWTPTQGKRPDMNGNLVDFDEHDNRATVIVYFCLHDQTVGLDNVQGIGTLGIPDTMTMLVPGTPTPGAVNTAYTETITQPLQQLGPRFYQRLFTWYHGFKVGVLDPKYELRKSDEEQYDGKFPLTRELAYTTVEAGETRNINAPALNPPITPKLHEGEAEPAKDDQRYQGQQHIDPIDARIALVKEGTRWGETDEQAILRYQTKEVVPNSYHSSIMSAEEHHRFVTAMDVPIGQGRCLDDEKRRKVLMLIADWRSDVSPKNLKALGLTEEYAKLDPGVRALAEATWKYYKTGKFPSEDLVPLTKIPNKIVSETLADRAKGVKK